MAGISDEDARQRLDHDARNVRRSDVRKVLNKVQQILAQFERIPILGRYLKDVRLMLALLADYSDGVYRDVSWKSIAAITAAMLYVINPFDLIPDWIPIIGRLDDVAVIRICLRWVEKDLARYEQWKQNQTPPGPSV